MFVFSFRSGLPLRLFSGYQASLNHNVNSDRDFNTSVGLRMTDAETTFPLTSSWTYHSPFRASLGAPGSRLNDVELDTFVGNSTNFL